MATPIFISDCGDSTGDFSEWTSLNNTPAIDSSVFHTGSRSIQCTSSGGLSTLIAKTGILADAGRRISFWFRVDASPNADCLVAQIQTAVGGLLWNIFLTATGAIKANGASTGTATSGTLLAAATWHRLCIAYTLTSATVNSLSVYLNSGAAEFTLTNAGLGATGSNQLWLGAVGVFGSFTTVWYDDLYIDTGTDLADPGNIRVTRKAPSALGTANGFDTLVGSGTNRYDRVAEVPITQANAINQAGSTQVSENFGVQSAAAGDVDISAGTIVGRTAWVYAKRDYGAGEIIATILPADFGTALTLSGTSESHFWPNSGTLPIGSTVVLSLSTDDAVVITGVTDSAGNTWSSTTGISSAVTGVRNQYFYSTLTAAITLRTGTFTLAHATSTVKFAAWAVCFAGVGSPTTFDKEKTNFATTGTAHSTGSTATLTQAAEIAFVTFAQNTSTAYSGAVSGWTDVGRGGTSGGSAATNVQVNAAYKQVNATTALSASVTGTSVGWVGDIVTFRVASDPTADPAGTPALIHDNVANSLVLTTAPSFFSNTITASAMPSTSAAVGLRSTSTAADSFLYECGIMVAYIPGAPTMPTVMLGLPDGAAGFRQMAQLLAQ